MTEHVTRRRALAALGAAGVTGLAGCSGGGEETESATPTEAGTTTGSSGDASGTVRVGVLQPVSGDLQYYGSQALYGFYSGLAHTTDTDPIPNAETGTQTVEAGDVTYELIVRDTQFSADTAQTAATNLVTSDDADMLFGCASSARDRHSGRAGQRAVPRRAGGVGVFDLECGLL